MSVDFWVILVVLELFVVMGAWAAWQEKTFSVAQIVRRYGQGLSFNRHGGMWGDLLVISPLMAYIAGRYGLSWSGKSFFVCLGIGGLASWGMHQAYRQIKIVEAHVIGGKLTEAGHIHRSYMACVLTILILFYFETPNPSPKLVIWTSVALVVHMIFGTHVVLGLFAPAWYPDRPIRNPATWVTILSCATLLAWRTLAIIH